MLYYKVFEIQDYEKMSRTELAEFEHTVGRNTLKILLNLHFGITEYEILIGEHGKPYLNIDGIFFNISHSKGVVICVVATENVGVDIERIDKGMSTERMYMLANRYFTQAEFDEFARKDFDAKCFFTLWPRKEAISKCLGTPLGTNLSICSEEYSAVTSTCENGYVYSIARNI